MYILSIPWELWSSHAGWCWHCAAVHWPCSCGLRQYWMALWFLPGYTGSASFLWEQKKRGPVYFFYFFCWKCISMPSHPLQQFQLHITLCPPCPQVLFQSWIWTHYPEASVISTRLIHVHKLSVTNISDHYHQVEAVNGINTVSGKGVWKWRMMTNTIQYCGDSWKLTKGYMK